MMLGLRWGPICAVLLTILCHTFATSLKQIVPVLIWGRKAAHHSYNTANNPFKKIPQTDFEKILMKRIGKATSPLLVFWQDNLCVEDLMQNEELKKLVKTERLEYFSAVESPLLAFEVLPLYNLTKEDDVEIVMENQLAMTQVADLSTIVETYNMVKNSSPNLTAVLTGNSCKYSESERIKRQAAAATAPAATENNTNEVIIEKERILMYSKEGFLWKASNDPEAKTLIKPSSSVFVPGDGRKNPLQLLLKYVSAPVSELRFFFSERSSNYWYIDRINATISGDKMVELTSNNTVYFPFNFSYHCSITRNYSFGDVRLDLLDLQVQVDARNSAFSDGYDCVGFTTIPIWSGILVTMTLAIIIMWGLVMIMDIRTMDRFDDPKGKTVTISALD